MRSCDGVVDAVCSTSQCSIMSGRPPPHTFLFVQQRKTAPIYSCVEQSKPPLLLLRSSVRCNSGKDMFHQNE
eukprot:356609-Chlamydomonas_euryale.AAC.3